MQPSCSRSSLPSALSRGCSNPPTARSQDQFWASDSGGLHGGQRRATPCPLRNIGSAPLPTLRPVGAEVAGDDPCELAITIEALQRRDDGALEREVALPQAEHDGIAREVGRGPFDAPARLRGELARQQPLRHADVEATAA